MYEDYTQQALPDREYRLLLGTALCVFASNNGFIIENILRIDNDRYNWYELIDLESGRLKEIIGKTITKKSGNTIIQDLFLEIVNMRNRIIHGFRITNEKGEQSIATKTRIKDGNEQFEITAEFLQDFISKNNRLSNLLHDFRGF